MQWLIGLPGVEHSVGRSIVDPLLPVIDGRGGGKTPFWQGVGKNAEGVDTFFSEFAKACHRHLS